MEEKFRECVSLILKIDEELRDSEVKGGSIDVLKSRLSDLRDALSELPYYLVELAKKRLEREKADVFMKAMFSEMDDAKNFITAALIVANLPTADVKTIATVIRHKLSDLIAFLRLLATW